MVPVGEADALREALDAALGTLVVVEKSRRLLLWEGVRIHLDEVEGLGSFLELEAPRRRGAAERAAGQARDRRPRRRELLRPPAGDSRAAARSRRGGHAQRLRAALGFKVGAALRTPTGAIYAGANVENAAYPQSQCAEASAIGALIAAGEREIAAVAVVAEKLDVCPPCGGCRQRLAEFAKPDTPVYLGGHETTTLGELLPLAFQLDSRAGARRHRC